MAETKAEKICQQCPDDDQLVAEWHCLDCHLDLCMRCVTQPREVPSLKSHKYVSCSYYDPSEVNNGKTEGNELLKLPKLIKEIENKNADWPDDQTSIESSQISINADKPEDQTSIESSQISKNADKPEDQTSLENSQISKNADKPEDQTSLEISQIVASASTLQNMMGKMEDVGSNPSWMFRYINGSIMDVLGNMMHVKTTTKRLPQYPFRMAFVNDQIWIRCGYGKEQKEGLITIAVYDQDLEKVTQIIDGHGTYIHTMQQISKSEVMVACSLAGLHLFDTDGKYVYKVLNGAITDVSTDGRRVAAVDYRKNNVIFLKKEGNKLQQESQFTVDDKENRYLKTLHLVQDSIFICYYGNHCLYKYSCTGILLHRYGTGLEGLQLGQLYHPYISGTDSNQSLVICDSDNHRVQILDKQGQWTQTTVTGIQFIHDIVVVGHCVYVLHGFALNKKLSKFCL